MTNNNIPPGSLIGSYLELSERGLSKLNQHTRVHSLEKHSIAVHKGDKVSGAYIVIRGCLRVFTYTPNGSESTLYLIHPGETCVFAINCLFNKLLYPAWVTAETDTEVAVIDGPTYKALFQRETAIQTHH
ncbi:MAG: cyclic nucleotide-binding domain-containing protein [Porticoccaceae bacterium]